KQVQTMGKRKSIRVHEGFHVSKNKTNKKIHFSGRKKDSDRLDAVINTRLIDSDSGIFRYNKQEDGKRRLPTRLFIYSCRHGLLNFEIFRIRNMKSII